MIPPEDESDEFNASIEKAEKEKKPAQQEETTGTSGDKGGTANQGKTPMPAPEPADTGGDATQKGPETQSTDAGSAGTTAGEGNGADAEATAPQVEPRDQSSANENLTRRYTLANGENIYVLSDGKAHSVKEKASLSPELQKEMDDIDKDPRYAAPAEVPEDKWTRAGKLLGTLAETVCNAYNSGHVAQQIGDFRLAVRSLLNGDLLGAVGGAVDASFDGITILGDGVDSFKNAVYKRYGIDPNQTLANTIKAKLCKKEIDLTREKAIEALEYMAKQGGKAFGLRDLQKYGISYDDDLLKEGGMSEEDLKEINDILDRPTLKMDDSGATLVRFTPEEREAIKYMIYTHDYGYDPELLGKFVNRLENQDKANIPEQDIYNEAVGANQTFDFDTRLGKFSEYRNMSPTDSLHEYYMGILKKQYELQDQIDGAMRGFTYEYTPMDEYGRREIKRDGLGNVITHPADKLKPVEIRALNVERQVLEQAANAVDAQTRGLFTNARKQEAQRRAREKAYEKQLEEQQVKRYESEPKGGAYQVLAGSKKNAVQYLYQGPDGSSVPAETFDDKGRSMWDVLDKKWRTIKSASGLSTDELMANPTYVSLYNAWACTDAYRTRDEWYAMIDTLAPGRRGDFEDEIEDWFEQTCSAHKWEGQDVTYATYQRKDLAKWAEEKLGVEYNPSEDNSLNHLISGCGIAGVVTEDELGGPMFPQGAGQSVNLLSNGLQNSMDGLYARYTQLSNDYLKNGKGLTTEQLIELKRLGVFRAYQLRRQSLRNLLTLTRYQDVRQALGSQVNIDVFNKQIMDLVGAPPGWLWKDGQVDLNTYVPTDQEAALEDDGYGNWDLSRVGDSKSGRTAALQWLKDRYGIDINEIAKHKSKGVWQYADKAKKTEESMHGGPLEITNTGTLSVGDRLDKLSRSKKIPNGKEIARDIRDQIASGTVSMDRMQYMVEHGTIPAFDYDGKDAPVSIQAAAKQALAEIKALQALGYIGKRDSLWKKRAKEVIWDSLCAPPRDKRLSQYKAFMDRVTRSIHPEKIDEMSMIASDLADLIKRDGKAVWTTDKKLEYVHGRIKDLVEDDISDAFRPSTHKVSGKAYTEALKKELPNAHECLSDPDVKEFLLDCAREGVIVDANTGLVHKNSRDQKNNSRYITQTLYGQLGKMREDIDAMPEGKDKDEALEKYEKIRKAVDVIDVVHHQIRTKTAKVTIPDNFTDWSGLVSELNTIRGKYGADLNESEELAFETEWKNLLRSRGFTISDKASKIATKNEETEQAFRDANRSSGFGEDALPENIKDVYGALQGKAGMVSDPAIQALLRLASRAGGLLEDRYYEEKRDKVLNSGVIREGFGEGKPYTQFGEGLFESALTGPDDSPAFNTANERLKTYGDLVKYYDAANKEVGYSFRNMLYAARVSKLSNEKDADGRSALVNLKGKTNDSNVKALQKRIMALPMDTSELEQIDAQLGKLIAGEIDTVDGLNIHALKECSGSSWTGLINTVQNSVKGNLRDASPEVQARGDELANSILNKLWVIGGFQDKVRVASAGSDSLTLDAVAPKDITNGSKKFIDVSPFAALRAVVTADNNRYRGYPSLMEQVAGEKQPEENEGDADREGDGVWFTGEDGAAGDLDLSDEETNKKYTPLPNSKFSPREVRNILNEVFESNNIPKPWEQAKSLEDCVAKVEEALGGMSPSLRGEILSQFGDGLVNKKMVENGALRNLTPRAQAEVLTRAMIASYLTSQRVLPGQKAKRQKEYEDLNGQAAGIVDELERKMRPADQEETDGADEEEASLEDYEAYSQKADAFDFEKYRKTLPRDLKARKEKCIDMLTAAEDSPDSMDAILKELVGEEDFEKYSSNKDVYYDLAWRLCRNGNTNNGKRAFIDNLKRRLEESEIWSSKKVGDDQTALDKVNRYYGNTKDGRFLRKGLFNTDEHGQIIGSPLIADLGKVGGREDLDKITLDRAELSCKAWVLDTCLEHLEPQRGKKNYLINNLDRDEIAGRERALMEKYPEEFEKVKADASAYLRKALGPYATNLLKEYEKKITDPDNPTLPGLMDKYPDDAKEIFTLLGVEDKYDALLKKATKVKKKVDKDKQSQRDKALTVDANIFFDKEKPVNGYNSLGSISTNLRLDGVVLNQVSNVLRASKPTENLEKIADKIYQVVREVKDNKHVAVGEYIDVSKGEKECMKKIYDTLLNLNEAAWSKQFKNLAELKTKWKAEAKKKKLVKSEGDSTNSGFAKAKVLRPVKKYRWTQPRKVLRPKKQ